MSSKPNLDKFLATRVTAQVHKKFHRKAKDYGKPVISCVKSLRRSSRTASL